MTVISVAIDMKADESDKKKYDAAFDRGDNTTARENMTADLAVPTCVLDSKMCMC